MLMGYGRALLAGKRYPAIYPDASSSVDGRLFRNVPKEALARIEFFEDNVYERLSLELKAKSGENVSALAYVARRTALLLFSYRPSRQLLLYTPFSC